MVSGAKGRSVLSAFRLLTSALRPLASDLRNLLPAACSPAADTCHAKTGPANHQLWCLMVGGQRHRCPQTQATPGKSRCLRERGASQRAIGNGKAMAANGRRRARRCRPPAQGDPTMRRAIGLPSRTTTPRSRIRWRVHDWGSGTPAAKYAPGWQRSRSLVDDDLP